MASQNGGGVERRNGDDVEQLRAEIRELRREVARLKAAAIVAGMEFPEPRPEPPPRPKLRLIKGGLVGAAVLGGVDWLRRHKPLDVALVAAIAGIAALIIWYPDGDETSEAPIPPAPTRTYAPTAPPTPTPTSLPTATTPPPTPTPTPRPTLTPTPTVLPTLTPRETPAPTTVLPDDQEPTSALTQPLTTRPISSPTSPSTTQPPTTAPPTMTPSRRPCVLRLQLDRLVLVCVAR